MSKYAILIELCITLLYYEIYGSDVAKEVDGGVQFINTGSVELVVPEILSFTVKPIEKSQLCVGDFVICYEASSTVMRDEKRVYYNLGTTCPLGTCTLMIHPDRAYYLSARRTDETTYLQFHDEFFEVCPRKVIDNRANFTILELPDCPVIMDNATLPKAEKKNNMTLVTVGIVAGCVIVILIFFMIIIITGYCIYKRLKR
uniref:ZP domain-containing protein n=1 Tax=Panagrellus redivivus TaxID=6233 RepID=A0A7E4V4R4_PANRE